MLVKWLHCWTDHGAPGFVLDGAVSKRAPMASEKSMRNMKMLNI